MNGGTINYIIGGASKSPESILETSESILETSESISESKSETSESKSETSSIDTEDDYDEYITGMRIHNPNPIQKKLQELHPEIFVKKVDKSGRFKSYAQLCPGHLRRQPVILTKKEWEKVKKINKEYEGSYYRKRPDDFTDPSWNDRWIKNAHLEYKNNYFICPRYLCLKNNMPMSEKQIMDGKCCGEKDKITKIKKEKKYETDEEFIEKELKIPFSAKKVPEGKCIIEFQSQSIEHTLKKDGKDGEYYDKPNKYKNFKPGFLPIKSHPDGNKEGDDRICMPCCFGNIAGDSQKKRYAYCKDNSHNIIKTEIYIRNCEKHPLQKGRVGWLCESVQNFLKMPNNKCFINKTTPKIAEKKPKCLYRYGVELNDKQSFIAAIADVFSQQKYIEDKSKKDYRPYSIKEFKNILINAISLDDFIEYFNGNLVELFQINSKEEEKIEIDTYKDQKVYKNVMKLNVTDTNEKYRRKYMQHIISSYEKFKEYLQDDDILIDYTYLWDIITKYNEKLHGTTFPNGLNLIIIDMIKDSASDFIGLICPTNRYVDKLFNNDKRYVILLKQNNYYHPLYLIQKIKNELNIDAATFSFYASTTSKQLPIELKNAIERITTYYNKCKPQPGKITEMKLFNIKKNLYANEIRLKLKRSYSLESQVINYNSSVIGLVFKHIKSEKEFFIPCAPSAIDNKYKYTMIDNPKIWKSYDETRDFLNRIYNRSKKLNSSNHIPCKPIRKIIEDNKVIGILTQTGQTVLINQPLLFTPHDGLEPLDISKPLDIDNNYNPYNVNEYDVDKYTLLNPEEDENRINEQKRIILENNFYNAFRNTLRILLKNMNIMLYETNLQIF